MRSRRTSSISRNMRLRRVLMPALISSSWRAAKSCQCPPLSSPIEFYLLLSPTRHLELFIILFKRTYAACMQLCEQANLHRCLTFNDTEVLRKFIVFSSLRGTARGISGVIDCVQGTLKETKQGVHDAAQDCQLNDNKALVRQVRAVTWAVTVVLYSQALHCLRLAVLTGPKEQQSKQYASGARGRSVSFSSLSCRLRFYY